MYTFYGKIIRFAICLATALLMSCTPRPNASQILNKALEAHGGIEKWESIQEISYLKTTILYDSLGAVEKKSTQQHTNIFKPSFTAEMKWNQDSVEKKVVLNKEKISIFYNDSLVKDTELEKKYYKDIIAANYVFWQPFKLLDDDVALSYVGKELVDGKDAHVLKAAYKNEDGSKGNTWWYYFDVKTNRLLGNMVHHAPTYSFIKNTKYEDQTGLFLNAERKSYRVDSIRNVEYLRGEYYYDVLYFK